MYPLHYNEIRQALNAFFEIRTLKHYFYLFATEIHIHILPVSLKEKQMKNPEAIKLPIKLK